MSGFTREMFAPKADHEVVAISASNGGWSMGRRTMSLEQAAHALKEAGIEMSNRATGRDYITEGTVTEDHGQLRRLLSFSPLVVGGWAYFIPPPAQDDDDGMPRWSWRETSPAEFRCEADGRRWKVTLFVRVPHDAAAWLPRDVVCVDSAGDRWQAWEYMGEVDGGEVWQADLRASSYSGLFVTLRSVEAFHEHDERVKDGAGKVDG